MNLNFAAALATLGRDAAFRIANAARPAAAYLLADILPEEMRSTYNVDAGGMTIRATMAGLVGMDSPYPPTGHLSVSKFLENTAKIGNETHLPEKALRTIQQMVATLVSNAGGALDTTNVAVQEALNFYNLIILQPQLDVSEYLRGQALAYGALNWQFGGKGLVVSYDVPPANILALRTIAGGTAYHLPGSVFFSDLQAIRRTLRSTGVRAILAHPDTIDAIRYNPAHNLVTVAESAGSVTFRRVVPTTQQFTVDQADVITLVSYGLEGEIINPANPAATLTMPFLPRGKLIGVGNNGARSGYRPGQGSQNNPAVLTTNRLGYTHIAPTTESGGRPGRWGEIYVPQNAPWSLAGRAASNQLPVIEQPDLLVIATTEMAP